MTDLAHRTEASPDRLVDSATGSHADPAEPPRGLIRPTISHTAPRRRPVTLALRVLVPLGIFGLWWLLTGTGAIPPTQLSSPLVTWKTMITLFAHQDLLGDIGISLARAAVGLAIGGTIGLLLGITTGLWTLGEELLDSSLQMLRTVPFPAVIFLFIIWFGIGETAKVALIALATLFPMYLNTSNGVRNVDRKVVEAARSFGLRGRQLVRQVVIPLAMPSILTGLRYSTGISIIALVFAETINANLGIGALASQASALQNTPVLVVCIIVYALLGIFADLTVRVLERSTMPWRRHFAVR
jgi:sulfonate transport system permease protein